MELYRRDAHLRTFQRLLGQYKGKEPLSRFLTAYYKANPSMGSRDRKLMTRWIYNWFRIGRAIPQLTVLQRLTVAEFLCDPDDYLLVSHDDRLNKKAYLSIKEKIKLLQQLYGFKLEDIFPFLNHLSHDIDQEKFLLSHLRQPKLFIRLRPNDQQEVKTALQKAYISFEDLGENCLALTNGTHLSRLKSLEGKYQVQDYSSQHTGYYFNPKQGEYWWDACAASGGKSLLLLQKYPGTKVLVSDIRSSILRNLHERFEKAGVLHYDEKIIDLEKGAHAQLAGKSFDGIILDVPCTGSGTWGRTPEMISSFHPSAIKFFTEKQRLIAAHAIPFLKSKKPLIYITCSVFAEENEEQISFIEKQGLELERMSVLKGYEQEADTMFIARFIKK